MTLRRPFSFAAVLTLMLPGAGALLQAADLYVSTAGLDTNPGTLEKPWRTIQKAAGTVVAGDVVHVRAGTYVERVSLNNRDGTSALPIVFQKHAPDTGAVVIDQTGVTPPTGTSALLTIQNCDHVVIRDIEFANYKTAGTNAQQKSQLPAGIFITGDGDGIKLLNCKVHDIWQSCTALDDFGANGFGIAVYGTGSSGINNLVIDGCVIYNLRTGASESLVLNGNVTNFVVTNNTVRDCNNIGIDFIGFEGTAPTEALDQARQGVCSGNVVYNVDSKFNPAYGGNFTTGGGDGTRSAPGIYVDGGRDIVIERNHVFLCNFAVSVGSEASGRTTDNIIVRNNVLHHCHVGGIVIGGSGTGNGGATGCSITNNTLYDNDTVGYGGGQVMIQHYVTSTVLQRNLMAATAEFVQFVVKDSTTGSFAAGAIDWNLYKRRSSGGSFGFIWNGTFYSNFTNWKNAASLAKDTNSTLTTGSLALVNNAPTSASPASDFALTSGSPARDTGDSAGSPFTPAAGEKDHAGNGRVANTRVDIGADEFMTAWQLWRDTHLGLPDGGAGANAGDDPDSDGVGNLLEYSQGMNPGVSDTGLLPGATLAAGTIRFSYRKAAPELSYVVQQNTTLPGTWTTLATPEFTDGAGLFWREILPGGPARFFRLQITQP